MWKKKKKQQKKSAKASPLINLCPSQMRRIQILQEKTQRMVLISWDWYEWWWQFQKPLKILHFNWYQFYLTKGYLRVDLVADCCFENFIKAEEMTKKDFATTMIIKPLKSKVPRDFSNFLSNGVKRTRLMELVFQTKQKKITHTECFENTTDDLLTWTKECVTENNRVLSKFSNI